MSTDVLSRKCGAGQLGRNASRQNCTRLGPVAQDMKLVRLGVGTKADADARPRLVGEIDTNHSSVGGRPEVAEANPVHCHWCAVELRQHIRQRSAKTHNGGGVGLLGQVLSDAPGPHLQVLALVTATNGQDANQSDKTHHDQGGDDLLFVHTEQQGLPIQIERLTCATNRLFRLGKRAATTIALVFHRGDVENNSFSMHQVNPTTDFKLASGFGLLLRADQRGNAGSQGRCNFGNRQRGATFFAAHLTSGSSVHGWLGSRFPQGEQGGHD